MKMACMQDNAENSPREFPPRTRRLKGLLKPKGPLAADWDYRDLLEKRMIEKFGG